MAAMDNFCILIELLQGGFVTRICGEKKGSDRFAAEFFSEKQCETAAANMLFYTLREEIEKATNNKAIPIVLLAKCAIEDSDLTKIAAQFGTAGYNNFQTVRYGKVLYEIYGGKKVMHLSAEGQKLLTDIYGEDGNLLSSKALKGFANNPKIANAIDLLWDSLGYDTYYFNKETEKYILTAFVTEFLKSGDNEVNDYITLSDGSSHQCFLSLREIEKRMKENALQKELVRILDDAEISGADCVLVIDQTLTENYQANDFSGAGFLAVKIDNESFAEVVYKQMLSHIVASATTYITPMSTTSTTKAYSAPPPPPPSNAETTKRQGNKTNNYYSPPPPPPPSNTEVKKKSATGTSNYSPPPPPPSNAEVKKKAEQRHND